MECHARNHRRQKKAPGSSNPHAHCWRPMQHHSQHKAEIVPPFWQTDLANVRGQKEKVEGERQ